MSRKNNEKFIVFVVTLAAVGLIIETMLMGWEFWVPVVIMAGIVSLWAVNFSDRIDYGIRKVFYFSSAALLVFYHGIHKTSLFDSALVVAFVMMIFTLFNSVYMMKMKCGDYEIFQHSTIGEEDLNSWMELMQSDKYYKKCTRCICG